LETPPFQQDIASIPATDKQGRRLRRSLILLLLLLGALLYLYWVLTRPPEPVGATKAPGVESLFSIYGFGKERLREPNGVAVSKSTGNIYIADSGNSRGVVFDRSGNFLFKFGQPSAKIPALHQKKVLYHPLSISVDESNGDIYLASALAKKISVFSKTGRFKRDMFVDNPIKVKVVGNKLYVGTDGSILITTLKGKVLKKWGTKGKMPRQFEYPAGLDLDKKGNLIISDSENNRIQILNKKGALVGGVGEPTRSLNQADRLFGLGMGLALDDKQRVYVVDAFHHSVRVFDHNGADFGELGRQGSADGQFNYPSDIAYAGGDVFAIADKWNDRIQVVRLTPPNKPVPKSTTKK